MRAPPIPLLHALCALGMLLSMACRAQSVEPGVVLNLSPSGIRALNEEFDDDLRSLDAFGGSRKNSFARVVEQPKSWMLYGRLGLLNFQNQVNPEGSTGTKFTLQRSGPRLTGKFYVGIHRRF